VRGTGCARVASASVIALLDGEIPQSAGGGSGDASGAEESDGGDCSASGSVGCSASPLVGEVVRITVLGEGCLAASSLVEQEASPKLSRLVATRVNGRRIVGAPLGTDSSLDRTLVIARPEGVSGTRGCGGKHLLSLS